MSILHGSWILQSDSDRLFIWGENWRSLVTVESNPNTEELAINPFCLPQEELIDLLTSYNLTWDKFLTPEISCQSRWVEQVINLPSKKESKKKPLQPIYSEKLAKEEQIATIEFSAWKITGFYLNATEAVKFLASLPLNSQQNIQNSLGAELVFWTHVYRWSLDLIARKKFLPGISLKDDRTAEGNWQPLLDSQVDLTRLAKFSQSMPSVCLAYQNQSVPSQELLLKFLGAIIDAQVRTWIDDPSINNKSVTIQPWLRSLSESNAEVNTENNHSARLKNALYNWTLPVQEYLVDRLNNNLGQNQYRTCFLLQPPPASDNKEQSDWQLKYCLQALDNSEFIIDAVTIWQNSGAQLSYQDRTITQPQETLLKGLGLAARIYNHIETSLQNAQPSECQLDPIQVYEFIRSIAWQLQDNGLGVKFPPGLSVGEGEQRLGIKMTAEVLQKKKERLNLQSLLQYKLEIAVGESTISKQGFKRLLAQKSPIVEVDGQWLVLQPADVKAAQSVLEKSNEQMNLSVEDALRLSTGNTTVLAKLPVVSFQATGILGELINNLTNNKSVQPIDNIEGFRGELRPYQARGVGWLAFLEQWGLGACLADDMGLGKTVQLIAMLLNLKQQDNLTKPTLLVCPTSVINNWEREVQKFAPSLKTLIHHGDKRSKGKTLAREVKDKQLVITSYSLVDRDLKTLEAINWEGVVLDEAQNIKNPLAKQSQSVRKLPAGFRVALTGTPVENRLSELWSILDFLNPGFLGTRAFFQKRFAVPIEKYGDRDSLQTLRSLAQPFILRRLKTDKSIIQDLPEKQEMNVFCGLSAEQAALYQQLADNSLKEIEDSDRN